MRDAIRAAPFLRSDHPALTPPARGPGAHARTPRSLALRGGQVLSAHGLHPGLRALAGSGRAPDVYVLEAADPALAHMATRWGTTDRYRFRMRQWLDKELESLPGDPVVIVLGARSVQGSLMDVAWETLPEDRWAVIAHKAVVRYPAHFDEWFRWGALYHRQTDFEDLTGPDAAARYLEQNREHLLEGAEVLWPEHESLEDLMLYRARRGWASFDAEKQGVPPGSKGFSVHVGEAGGDPTRCTDDAGYARESNLDDGFGESRRFVLRLAAENLPDRKYPPRFGEHQRGGGFKVRVLREDEVDMSLPHEREF